MRVGVCDQGGSLGKKPTPGVLWWTSGGGGMWKSHDSLVLSQLVLFIIIRVGVSFLSPFLRFSSLWGVS